MQKVGPGHSTSWYYTVFRKWNWQEKETDSGDLDVENVLNNYSEVELGLSLNLTFCFLIPSKLL